MSAHVSFMQAIGLIATSAAAFAQSDPRLRDIVHDPHVVVSVPVQRGVVTDIELDADETISEVASGLGADCSKPDAVWCIAAQAGGRSVFVKPKTGASAANNLVVVTDRRTHVFRLVLIADGGAVPPLYRLTVHAPAAAPVAKARPTPRLTLSMPANEANPAKSAAELVAERLQTAPRVVNAAYSLAEGKTSADIVPTLVFDDGRFTYFRFPGNRQIPAVFDVLDDDSETVVNTRMEGDLLVVDRVGRRLMLRAGTAVVGIWNDAFDLDGVAPSSGTTAAGVRRVVRGGDTTGLRTGTTP